MSKINSFAFCLSIFFYLLVLGLRVTASIVEVGARNALYTPTASESGELSHCIITIQKV